MPEITRTKTSGTRTRPSGNNNNNNNAPDRVSNGKQATICTRRAGKLYKARSRLYRSQILQVNTRWNSYLFEKKIEKRERS